MAQVDYRFSLDFFRADGSAVGQAPVDIDWEPAIEWTHFDGVRSGRLPAIMNVGPARIEPIWDRQLGEPHVSGFRVVTRANEGADFCAEIPSTYVRDLARENSSNWVEKGKLKAGEVFKYRVCAFAHPKGREISSAAGFSVEEIDQPLDLAASSLGEFIASSRVGGSEFLNPSDLPVFIPSRVLEEVTAATTDAGDLETGGVLVGKLHCDRSVPDIFVEVTAQIRAWHAQAQHTKLTFTSETWDAVRAAIELRKQNEVMLGWWHCHPDFCKHCAPEKRVGCAYSRPFFSSEDCALQRAVFGRAFNVGLLASYLSAGALTHTLFGWRQGMVAPRGFHVLPDTRQPNGLEEEKGHAATNL